MTRLLIIKTGALGDVLRTTSILSGLAHLHPELSVTWVTSHAARELVQHHPLVNVVEGVAPGDAHELRLLAKKLTAHPFDRVLSFDDEEPLCRLASAIQLADSPGAALSGAYLDDAGERVYTDDVAPWFDMGLISRYGKERADRLKVENTRSHGEIFAGMLGVAPGKPGLELTPSAQAFALDFSERWELDHRRPLIGLNTGASGRWPSKALSVERTVAMAARISEGRSGRATFLVLGGPEEKERNRAILSGMRAREPKLVAIDAGAESDLQEFASLVGLLDLLVTSDSLALHLGIALERKIVCFFAPTSAAEIDLYGQGLKVVSSAADYCSYRPNTDNSTITPEDLCEAVLELLA